MSGLQKGDKVRVCFEGEVRSVYPAQTGSTCWDVIVQVSGDGGAADTFVRSEHVSVIEPAYEEGSAYIDADGDIFVYWPDVNQARPWFAPGESAPAGDSYPTRPLRKLVAEA